MVDWCHRPARDLNVNKNTMEETTPSDFLECEGACTCDSLRYRVRTAPLIVHGCHCRLCQRQTGAAYAVNALIEDVFVDVLAGSLDGYRVATPSGAGQTIYRCSVCQVAVWSKYHAMPKIGERILFLRVGTLADPDRFPPDVHIHATSRQQHVQLPDAAAVFDGFYDFREVWSAGSKRRYAALVGEA